MSDPICKACRNGNHDRCELADPTKNPNIGYDDSAALARLMIPTCGCDCTEEEGTP